MVKGFRWYDIEELSDAYDRSYRETVGVIRKGHFPDEYEAFEDVFVSFLSDKFDIMYGKQWVIRPSIVEYGYKMTEEAMERYVERHEEGEDEYD